MERKSLWISLFIVISLLFTRIIPHAPNFTSAMAGLIFGGVILRKGIYAIIILIGYYIADLLINNITYSADQSGFQWTSQSFGYIYISLFLSYFISRLFSNSMENPLKIIGVSLVCSILFFTLSNFGVWMEGLIYTQNISGLITCYVAALPYLMNEIAASIFFSCLYFGVYWLYETRTEQKVISHRI